jgi:hypothetical protein
MKGVTINWPKTPLPSAFEIVAGASSDIAGDDLENKKILTLPNQQIGEIWELRAFFGGVNRGEIPSEQPYLNMSCDPTLEN